MSAVAVFGGSCWGVQMPGGDKCPTFVLCCRGAGKDQWVSVSTAGWRAAPWFVRHRLAALTTRQVRAGETARAAGNLQEADGAPVCRSVCESRLSSRGVGGKAAAPETLDIAAVASTLSLPVREIRLACWRYLLIAGMLISFISFCSKPCVRSSHKQ